MKVFVNPRRKDQRGTYCIYPVGGSLDNSFEIARVKARTPTEAILIAKRKYIPESAEVYAVELIEDDRIAGIED